MTGKDLHNAYNQAQTEMPKRGQRLRTWEEIEPTGQESYEAIASQFSKIPLDNQTGGVLYLLTNTYHGESSSAYRIAFKDMPENQKAIFNRVAELLTAKPE
jgi:hypothetical protein